MNIRPPQGIPWQVVYNLSKREKAVHEQLEMKDICSYLPLHCVVSQWSDRKKKIESSLTP
jgi:transcriptional antiterminator RfaH